MYTNMYISRTHRFHSLQALSIHKTYSIILFKSIILSTILVFQETWLSLYNWYRLVVGEGIYIINCWGKSHWLQVVCYWILWEPSTPHHATNKFSKYFYKTEIFCNTLTPGILYFCSSPFELIFLSQSEIAAAMHSILIKKYKSSYYTDVHVFTKRLHRLIYWNLLHRFIDSRLILNI